MTLPSAPGQDALAAKLDPISLEVTGRQAGTGLSINLPWEPSTRPPLQLGLDTSTGYLEDASFYGEYVGYDSYGVIRPSPDPQS